MHLCQVSPEKIRQHSPLFQLSILPCQVTSFLTSKDAKTIVIDLGHGSVKAGFGGEAVPRSVVPTILGNDGSVGDAALSKAGSLTLVNPLDGDKLNADNCQKLLRHVFDDLHQDPSGCSILISEPLGNPVANRETLAQLIFETFSASSLYIASSVALDAFSQGHMTAIVVDSGDRFTQFVPICDGWQLPGAATKIEFGGRNITQYLAELLKSQQSFSSPSELQIVRDIKEKQCYVATNYDAELKAPKPVSYTLPTATDINLGIERFKCAEIMFQPSLAGLHHENIAQVCRDTLAKVPEAKRGSLSGKILLCGGNFLFEGARARFASEIGSEYAVVPSEVNPKYSTFAGGSILTQHPTYGALPVTRAEYQAEGGAVLARKCKQIA